MQTLKTPEECVEALLSRLGKRIQLGIPLGVGKPNHLVNALYRRAQREPSLELTIYTALTLNRPRAESELERRFLEPLNARLFGSYPDLLYELDRSAGRLPANVRVIEFYFQAGKHLHTRSAQQDYISSNYTHVARDLLDRGVNAIAQQVCAGTVSGRPKLSLSCNPDLGIDLARGLRARERRGAAVACVAQLNDSLPFMHGEALVDPDFFDFVVDHPDQHYPLFAPPKNPISDADALIGLYGSALIRDGGELQIGIGALGDALVYALKLRHEQNARYVEVLDEFAIRERFPNELRLGELGRFERGLFAATEMLVDAFMPLFEAGILKRKVYDDVTLSRLLNEGSIDERVTPDLLDKLCARHAIEPVLRERDFAYLVYFGILRPELCYREGQIVFPSGEALRPDLTEPSFRQRLQPWLGTQLAHGAVIHAAFFVGPNAFYDWLRQLPEDQRQLIDMRSVTRINQLYGHEEIDRLHRRDARFLNTCMKVSMLGAVTSDAIEDGRVVSGVGGQYNFVAMAHELPGGRSVLQLRSTRAEDGRVISNLVWSYGQVTIPRHLRDLVVTEYGIAELRGKTDAECVQALLAICDSRFQDGLTREAKRIGKLPEGYRIPDRHRHNLPSTYGDRLRQLRARGLFPAFPFGTDLSHEEQVLAEALQRLKFRLSQPKRVFDTLLHAAADGGARAELLPYLRRMGLDRPRGVKEHVYQRLLLAALRGGDQHLPD